MMNRSILVLAAAIVPSVVLADWPQWRGPERTGYAPSEQLVEDLPPGGIKPVWTLESFPGGNNGGWSSPVISNQRVYVYAHTKTKNAGAETITSKFPWLPPEKRVGMTDEEYAAYERNRRDENERQSKAFRFDERLVCLDLSSGEVIWDRSQPSTYTRFVHSGTPCVAGDRVFVLGAQRTAHCYDARTGEPIWSQRLPGDFRDQFFASSFVAADGVALVACGPLIALRADDGQLLWQGDSPLDYQSHSSPAVWQTAEGAVAIANTAGGVTQAYRVADGTKLWEVDSGAGQSTPIVADQRLLTYGSSRKNGLTAYQLDPGAPSKEPELAWRFQRAADSGSTPVVRGDDVFVQGDKRLARVALEDGDAAWQTTLRISNPRYTSLIAAGDQVFYAWQGVLAFRADADRFEPLYDAKIDSDRHLIATDDLRRKLELDEIASSEGGAAKSEKLWQQKAVKSGPLDCSTPAFSDGRMVIRLRNAVVCYDLRQ